MSASVLHKKIMVAHSFFLKNDSKQHEEKIKPYPPLATLHAASVLRARGYPIALFDAQLAHGMIDFFSKFSDIQPDILVLYEDDFNFLTKMCLSHVREAAFEMINFAKNPALDIIVHSADATDHPTDYLSAGADYVVAGEGEETLLELTNWLSLPSEQTQPCPAGVIYKYEGEIVRSPARPTMRHLGHLPQPAWDLIDFKSYEDVWLQNHGSFSLNMVTTRGCPYKCNWCSKPIWGQQYVSHSPEYIVKQLEVILSQAQPDHIWFADDIFGLKKGWVEEFSALIKSKKIDINYTTQTRADLISTDFANALKYSGCDQVWLGVESGSQAVINAMYKGITIEQIINARVLLKANSIKVGFFIQLGYPEEDVHELNETRGLILRLLPEEIGVSVSYPLPGTKFFERVKSELQGKTNWRESSDLDPTFISTFTAEFYHQIRDHLHSELKHVNAGKDNKYFEEKWRAIISKSNKYRNRPPLKTKEPAE